MRGIFIKTAVVFSSLMLMFGCYVNEYEGGEYVGNVDVHFVVSSFNLYNGEGPKHIEGMEFGIFPTDFDQPNAWRNDAIAVGVIHNQTCMFDNILMGTYKIAFLDYPGIFKVIQVIPDKTVDIPMLD